MKNNHEVEVLSTKVKKMKNSALIRLVLVGSLTLSLQAEFLRDATKEIVLDTKTNLVWQDNSEAKTITKTWSEAISYCENLTFASYDDWRLPNINELKTIVDSSRYSPAIKSQFVNVASSYYWSSTTYASYTSYAWFVYFNVGGTDDYDKALSGYVRCVRDGQ